MTTTKDARGVDESGVFPTVRLREVDIDRLLASALETAALVGVPVEMERGAVLRVSLRRDLDGWSVSLEHSLLRQVPLDDGVDELAFARSVLLGHDGAFVIRTDPVRRVRVILASLPPLRR